MPWPSSLAERALAGIALLAAGSCGSLQSPPQDRLIGEIQRLAENPKVRRVVLLQATYLHEPALAGLGLRFLDDEDPETQLFAYLLALESDSEAPRLVVTGLMSVNRFVRRACAAKAADPALRADADIDATLQRSIREEQDSIVYGELCTAYVKRHGRVGADFVYRTTTDRGPGYQLLATKALALEPDVRYADAFRNAIDGRLAPYGRRGLAKLGMLEKESSIAYAAEFGDEMTLDEYGADYQRHIADLGAMRESSFAELARDAINAKVVILAESHFSGFVIAWEMALLEALHCSWKPQDPGVPYDARQLPALACESRQIQKELVARARTLGWPTFACEEHVDDQLESLYPDGWVIERRDKEAIGNLENWIRADDEDRWVVVYGAHHTDKFSRMLRKKGIAAVRVILSGNQPMRANAMRLAGSLGIAGRVFRYEDGTYLVEARPYGAYGCPELDWLLAAPATR